MLKLNYYSYYIKSKSITVNNNIIFSLILKLLISDYSDYNSWLNNKINKK